MTPQRFEEIKEQIETARQEKARAEGSIQTIAEELKEKFNISSFDEIPQVLANYEEQLELQQQRFDTALAELEAAANWDSL